MISLCWFLATLWLAHASTATSQFNTTVNFTLTSMDPMIDMDGALRDRPLTLDERTGYRKFDFARVTQARAWFVGTGFEAHGFGTWDNETEKPTSAPMVGRLKYVYNDTQQPRDSTPYIQYLGNERGAADGFGGSSLPLAAYELTFMYYPFATAEFHKLTVQVPI